MTLKVKVMEWLHTESTTMYKGNDLEFQGHAIEIEYFNYHYWIS